MFKMFLHPVPTGTPLADVYRQHRAYGPYGNRAWQTWEDPANSGFAEWLTLDIRESAPVRHRELRAVCDGFLTILPHDVGQSPARRTVILNPTPVAWMELERLAGQLRMDAPTAFHYDGVHLEAMRTRLTPLIEAAPNPQNYALNTRVMQVLEYSEPIPVKAGFVFGDASPSTSAGGWLRIGFRNVASDRNLQDPVAYFHGLIGRTVRSGAAALDAAAIAGTWLEATDRNRILIELRDEWNQPLRDVLRPELTGDTPDELVEPILDAVQRGVIAAPGGWGEYHLELGNAATRRINAVPSWDAAVPSPIDLVVTAPAHRVFQTFDLADWLTLRNPMHPTAPGGVTGTELSLFTEGNVAEPLIDGIPYFKRLWGDLYTLDDPTPPATGPHGAPSYEHFAFFADWYIDEELELVPSMPDSQVLMMLRRAHTSPGGAIVRLLAWAAPNDQNIDAIRAISELDGNVAPGSLTHAVGEAVGPAEGAFHWKCNVIRNRLGTVAHVGGIDLHTNRLDGPLHLSTGRKYHDVHLRLQGPATADVLSALRHRYWLNTSADSHTDSLTATIGTPAGTPATAIVQITRTAPPGPAFDYPTGDRTTWANVAKAVDRARRYIYIEEQYLVAAMLSERLEAALARAPDLEIVIVIPAACDQGVPPTAQAHCDRARSLFVRPWIRHSRVQVFSISDYFVHSKVVIVDDIIATIGSANMNRRGFTFDREINGWVFDGRVENGRRKFAHDLRVRLWAEHLGFDMGAASLARLSNITEAVAWLRKNPPGSHLVPYTLQNPGSTYPALWDSVVDPDGTP